MIDYAANLRRSDGSELRRGVPSISIRRPVFAPLVLLLCLASAGARAAGLDTLFEDKRIGVGVEASHKAGIPLVSASAGPLSFLAWDSENLGIGLTLPLGPKKGLNFGIGGFLAYRTDEVLGTHANFLVRGSYCWTEVCASVAHISHGRIFGFEEHAPNKGLNFLYLEYRFK